LSIFKAKISEDDNLIISKKYTGYMLSMTKEADMKS